MGILTYPDVIQYCVDGEVDPDVAPVMAVGAYGESGWDTERVGDQGHSIGLFQLHDAGMGAGLSVATRENPRIQVQIMRPEYTRWYRHWESRGYRGVELVWRTCCYAERPKDYTDPESFAARNYRDAYSYVVSVAGEVFAQDPPDIAASEYVFPVRGAHSFIDSHWDSDGDGRPDLAVDIFAAHGTELVAVTSGFVTIRDYPNGGHTAMLSGDDGRVYYYAHLVQGSGQGGYKQAGAVLGQVDNTGNARTTPAHCHWAMGTAAYGIDNAGAGDLAPWAFLRQLDTGETPFPEEGSEEDMERIADLERIIGERDSLLGYLQTDVAQALTDSVLGARGADFAASKSRRNWQLRQDAYDSLDAAVDTLRRGGAPELETEAAHGDD